VEAVTIFSLIAVAGQSISDERAGQPRFMGSTRRARDGKIGGNFAALKE